MQHRPILLLVTIASFVVWTPSSNGSTNWHYSGTTYVAFPDDNGVMVPAGQKVFIDIAFDPLTPDSNATPGIADYLMWGGDALLQVRIGEHLSTPVNRFRLTVITEGCCAANDQYNFLSHESQGAFFDIDFPGFFEGNVTARLAFFRRKIPGPITSDALPLEQPNPAAFQQVQFSIAKNVFSSKVIPVAATLDAIPEPGCVSIFLGCASVLCFRGRREF